MEENEPKKYPETLEFVVYGGICAILGFLSIIILFFTTVECKPAVLNAIGRSIVSFSLGILTIHFGRRSKAQEGKVVIIGGIIILILVGLTYIFGIIPCALS